MSKIKDGTKAVGETLKTKVIGYLLAGFGVVAALAWNDAIKALIDQFFPAEESGLAAKFIYALIVTLFVVIITLVLAKVFKTEEKSK
ncbi:MAG: DUF5654 family protein [Patescibacteria group bacterium]